MHRASEDHSSSASPSVSVIIPIYNVEKYLRKCLDSILSQTLGPERTELICIDDGSTDGTPAILADYAARHPNLTALRQENRGPSVARNSGLEIATGEYILFMDSDDWLSRPDALELLCARADEMRLDELIFCGDVCYEDADPSTLFRSRPRYFLAEYDYNLVSDGQETYVRLSENDDYPVVIWRRIYRRSFLLENKLRFIPGIVHQDQIFSRECTALARRVNCWDLRCHTYLVRQNSISAQKKKFPGKSIYARLVGLNHLEEFARERLTDARPEFMRAYRAFMAGWCSINVKQYLHLPREQKREFWSSVPEDERERLRAQMSESIRSTIRRKLAKCFRHPVQSLRAAMR